MHSDLPFLIALSKIKQIGPVTAKSLISYCGSAEQVFKERARALVKIPTIGEKTAKLMQGIDPQQLYESELQFVGKHSIEAIAYFDQNYPYRLKQIQESPIVIYWKGTTDLNARRMISIVGTRKPSEYGLMACEKLVNGLQDYQPVIVSGLAYGIDVSAHRTSLSNGLDTIGVLGHSLETIYPAQHRNVARKMTTQGGLLSEFSAGTRIDKENFPMRNRIVAAMSDGIIVIESAAKGGSMITAHFGNAYNKDVFAVPGRINDPLSQGCNQLIKKNRAISVEDATDIAYHLNWEKEESDIGTQQALFEPLNATESTVMDCLRNFPNIHIDRLSLQTNLSPAELATALLQMEFRGIVKSLPGKRYILI